MGIRIKRPGKSNFPHYEKERFIKFLAKIMPYKHSNVVILDEFYEIVQSSGLALNEIFEPIITKIVQARDIFTKDYLVNGGAVDLHFTMKHERIYNEIGKNAFSNRRLSEDETIRVRDSMSELFNGKNASKLEEIQKLEAQKELTIKEFDLQISEISSKPLIW